VAARTRTRAPAPNGPATPAPRTAPDVPPAQTAQGSPCGPCGKGAAVPRMVMPEAVATPPPAPGPPEGGAEASSGAGVSGGPSAGPSGSSTTETGTGTEAGSGTGSGIVTGTPAAPGNGASSSGSNAFPGEAFAGNFADSFLTLIQNASSGDALEAQDIILRRIALEGDVVPSRVPAPLNITEIGGYLNLLGTLNQTDMQSQVLAGILGVAGPNPPLGWLSTKTQLSFMTMANDRPEGAAQPTIPLTVPVRSDFLPAVQAALSTLHEEGCLVPFMAGPSTLPMAQANVTAPGEPLPYLGRVLQLASTAALSEPASDALALARPAGGVGQFQMAAIARGEAAASVTPGDYEALVCTSTACAPSTLTGAALVYLAPVFASAGFYPASPLPQPTSSGDSAWARLTNVTGLIAGTTKLGDELALLYPSSTISESVFADALGWLWNGSSFAPPA
jgi:hypothetical protein